MISNEQIAQIQARAIEALRESPGFTCPNAGHIIYYDIPALIDEVLRLKKILAKYVEVEDEEETEEE